jgi:Na+-driven multidrug efflux pump
MMVLAVYFAVLGDAATAATIGVAGTLLNTALTALVLRWLNRGNKEIRNTGVAASAAASAAAAAADSAADAAQSALEACRVSKAIGSAIRHDDPLIVKPPESTP